MMGKQRAQQKPNGRANKKKKEKIVLKFDEKEREEFLTGFQKRKNERRKKAKDDVLLALKEEKRRLREKRRTELAARRAKFDELFERREEETESKTYDLSQHLVTVTEVAEVDLADEGTHLGCNQDDEEDGSDCEAAEKDPGTSGEGGSRKVHRRRKTFTHRFDKHFKLKERIKMKKSGAPKQKKPKKQKRNH